MNLGVVQADDISHIRVFPNRVRQAKANTYVGENIDAALPPTGPLRSYRSCRFKPREP